MEPLMDGPTKRLTSVQSRAKADECRDLARVATKPEHSIMLRHIAETWERIAQEASDKRQDN
jgi:hypothetical protein